MILEKESQDVKRVMQFLETMDPWDFEYLCAQALYKRGFYYTEVTKKSGDHGVDILALKKKEFWGIQCKRWASDRYVDTSAVDQAFLGCHYYGCTHGAVLTTTLYTERTKVYAVSKGIQLWDRYQLYYMVREALHGYGL